MMVSGAGQAHLWVFDGERGLRHIVEPDAGAMEAIRMAWDSFAMFRDTDSPPPLLVDADTVHRDDAPWAQAAQAYAQAKLAAQANES
jgi:hypothetical protein